MAGNNTATVDTLTAQVRVLMVGSRQVTVGVYNQLDPVEYEEIIPFGRVAPKDGNSGHIYVVGKNISSGELVRSSLPIDESAVDRWVRARSQADRFERSADVAKEKAVRLIAAADEYEKNAVGLLGDGYGAAHRSKEDAERYEKQALENDDAAGCAESETERLSLLAEAAKYRLFASRARDKYAESRSQAEQHRARAEESRKSADLLYTEAAQDMASCQEWGQWQEEQASCVRAIGGEWAELPLIVLAGLR